MFHGSPNRFDTFNTSEVFLSKTFEYANRYGSNVAKVSFTGTPKFETPTIVVVSSDQITTLQWT